MVSHEPDENMCEFHASAPIRCVCASSCEYVHVNRSDIALHRLCVVT